MSRWFEVTCIAFIYSCYVCCLLPINFNVVAFVVVTCVAPASVSDCSVDSNQATYNYSDTIVYTCDVGFEKTSGDLTRACQADSSWSGSPPVCTCTLKQLLRASLVAHEVIVSIVIINCAIICY